MMEKKETVRKHFIPVVTKKETSKVFTSEILYIEKDLRLINIYTYNRVYTYYGKINSLREYLGDNFYKCHNSCIINFENIIRIEDGIFFFEGELTLRIGQNNYQHTKKQYSIFIAENCKRQGQGF